MNSQQKVINLLTMCRKAAKLVLGFDVVKEAIYEGNVSCVIVSDDISPNTLKEVRFICKNSNIDIVTIGLDSYEFFDAVGKKVVVAAVCDYGFSEKFKLLGVVKKPTSTGRKRKTSGNNSE